MNLKISLFQIIGPPWCCGRKVTPVQGWGNTEMNLQQSEFPLRTRHLLEEHLFQFPPCHSKHSHNSQGKPETSAQWEDAKSCQIMGNTNTQPGFCLCLLRQSNRNNNFLEFMWLHLKTVHEGNSLNQRCYYVSRDISRDRFLLC